MGKLTAKHKDMIDIAFKNVMNETATEEQELIWILANQIHCVNTRRKLVDDNEIQELLDQCDFTL